MGFEPERKGIIFKAGTEEFPFQFPLKTGDAYAPRLSFTFTPLLSRTIFSIRFILKYDGISRREPSLI
jgi:hypothetical protein